MTTAVLDMPSVQERFVGVPNSTSRSALLQNWLADFHTNQFAEIKKSYQIIDEERVQTFLRTHSRLISILLEGRGVVGLFFGTETPILLHPMRDPEVGLEYLVAWIQTTLPTDEALDRLAELDETWFGNQLDIVGDLLNYNLGGA